MLIFFMDAVFTHSAKRNLLRVGKSLNKTPLFCELIYLLSTNPTTNLLERSERDLILPILRSGMYY